MIVELNDASLAVVREALRHAESRCRWHGRDFGRLGMEPWGEPRCESCRQPYRVCKALTTLTYAMDEATRKAERRIAEGLERSDPKRLTA